MMQTQSKHNHIIQINFRIVLYSTCKIAQTYLYFTSDWMRLWLQNLCWLKNKIMENKSIKKNYFAVPYAYTTFDTVYILNIQWEAHADAPSWTHLHIQYLATMTLLVDGRGPGLPWAGDPTRSGRSGARVQVSRSLQSRQHGARSLLLGHLLQLCSQLLWVDTWRALTLTYNTHTHTTAIAQKQSLFNLQTNMNTFSTVRSVRRLITQG